MRRHLCQCCAIAANCGPGMVTTGDKPLALQTSLNRALTQCANPFRVITNEWFGSELIWNVFVRKMLRTDWTLAILRFAYRRRSAQNGRWQWQSSVGPSSAVIKRVVCGFRISCQLSSVIDSHWESTAVEARIRITISGICLWIMAIIALLLAVYRFNRLVFLSIIGDNNEKDVSL